MSTTLRVLQVEDSESDAALIVRFLEQGGFEVSAQRVEEAGEMTTALARTPWDVIICDYNLPQFGCLGALRILHEAGLDIPFIVISGVIGEETAAEMMRLGAHDYLLKESLVRLAPAVQREMKAAEARQETADLQTENSSYETKLEELKQVAFQDPLTGLSNRREVERQIAARIQTGQVFCVVCLDLKGFKELNDTFGHLAGDDLLKQFATQLRTAFRSHDVVGRTGGDEFVVLVDHDLPVAKTRLERIRRWVKQSYALTGNPDAPQVKLTTAGGVVQWKPGESMRDVLRRADAAMYADKPLASVTTRRS
jgi:diguanylate cyclase (GGDEF)-like protein